MGHPLPAARCGLQHQGRSVCKVMWAKCWVASDASLASDPAKLLVRPALMGVNLEAQGADFGYGFLPPLVLNV